MSDIPKSNASINSFESLSNVFDGQIYYPRVTTWAYYYPKDELFSSDQAISLETQWHLSYIITVTQQYLDLLDCFYDAVAIRYTNMTYEDIDILDKCWKIRAQIDNVMNRSFKVFCGKNKQHPQEIAQEKQLYQEITDTLNKLYESSKQ